MLLNPDHLSWFQEIYKIEDTHTISELSFQGFILNLLSSQRGVLVNKST